MSKNTKQLTLTLVIPVFNDENHLKLCLESVMSQTVKPDHVLLVDNNCSDSSIEIAQSFKNVKIIQERKQGVLYARNRAFDSVNTDIIGRIDSDTILPINWVAKIKEFYSIPYNRNSAITGGCYFYNIRLPHLSGWWQDQIAFRLNRILLGHYILFGSNMAITRRQWDKVKNVVCRDLDVHEDLDLAIHMHELGYKIYYDDKLIVGVAMKRVKSNRSELWDNLVWWPKTLRKHNKKTWILGYAGSLILFVLAPFIPFIEKLARMLGFEPVED